MKEMKKLFKLQSHGWLDLYYNDAYGLNLSIKEMENKVTNKKEAEKQTCTIQYASCDLEDFLIEVKLKFNFYMLAVEKKGSF
jgi:hypothetical protein